MAEVQRSFKYLAV